MDFSSIKLFCAHVLFLTGKDSWGLEQKQAQRYLLSGPLLDIHHSPIILH